jgi:hypothetical protein
MAMAARRKRNIAVIGAFAFGIMALDAQAADELKCEGPFSSDSDHKRLVTAFGRSNVTRTIVHEEAEEIQASLVFPKDQARSVEVIWHDQKARKRPAAIQVSGNGWYGPKGIRVGMTLSEVESLNGRPFLLYGFSWDFGGTVSDWKGGSFASLSGGCRLIVIFSPDPKSDEAVQMKVASDNEFGSDQAEIKAVSPRVEKIGVSYPQ